MEYKYIQMELYLFINKENNKNIWKLQTTNVFI